MIQNYNNQRHFGDYSDLCTQYHKKLDKDGVFSLRWARLFQNTEQNSQAY